MISRYSRKELVDIWSEENKYKIWLEVEIAAAQAMEKLGQIPKGVSSTVRKKAKINVKRIHQIEGQVKHDVIAFLTSVTEKAGIKARYLHQGMTSSDVLDTSFNIQLVQSGKIILKDLEQILKVLKKQARKYKFTPCMGRSHGIHAEPITFGLKLASFYAEFKRNKKRLSDAIDEISTCAISGAVGTFANINPIFNQDDEQLKISIKYNVEKGEKYKVNKITISGNTRTRDKVIRREIKIKEQENYSGTKIKKSKSFINRRNYFEFVNIKEVPSKDKPNYLDLEVEVEEKPTGYFSIQGGYSSVEALLLGVQIQENTLFGYG